jgi:hypothetical protein
MDVIEGVNVSQVVTGAVWKVVNATHPHKWDPNSVMEWHFQDVTGKREWTHETPLGTYVFAVSDVLLIHT